MKPDYYAVFGPLRMTREELARPLGELLLEMNATVETQYDPLTMEDGELVHTFERQPCISLADAIETSQQWAGLEFNLVYGEFGCSFVIWNDTPKSTTVAFCVPHAVLGDQPGDAEAWESYIEMLLIPFMQSLRAPLCVVEIDSSYKTPSPEDVAAWVADMEQQKFPKYLLAIARESYISANVVPAKRREKDAFREVEDIDGWMLQAWHGK